MNLLATRAHQQATHARLAQVDKSVMNRSGDLALVTGASGFLGSAVARILEARGLNVRALVRPSSRRENLAGLAGEICEGDVRIEADF
jgi:nucleoside-diphosphate-sugar epimerase